MYYLHCGSRSIQNHLMLKFGENPNIHVYPGLRVPGKISLHHYSVRTNNLVAKYMYMFMYSVVSMPELL